MIAVRQLFQLKKTERLWHIPVLAALSTGIPLLIGFYADRLDYGIQACIGGLVGRGIRKTRIAILRK